MREHWGEKTNFYHFFFFQAQAFLAAALSITFIALLKNQSPNISLYEYLGFAIWILGIIGETIADKQLANFRANSKNKGKTCRVGLWHYSRHPNYFFEWTLWLSYSIMAIGTLLWWIPALNAIIMFIFITKLTGIPYTELQAIKSRGEDYKRYQETTSAFIPWTPKKIK